MDREVTMDITMETKSGEETKLPTVTEARAKFDKDEVVPKKKVTKVEIQPRVPAGVPLAPKVQPKPKAPVPTPVPEVMPKKVVKPLKKPVAPPAAEKVKSPSPRLINFIIFSLSKRLITNYDGLFRKAKTISLYE